MKLFSWNVSGCGIYGFMQISLVTVTQRKKAWESLVFMDGNSTALTTFDIAYPMCNNFHFLFASKASSWWRRAWWLSRLAIQLQRSYRLASKSAPVGAGVAVPEVEGQRVSKFFVRTQKNFFLPFKRFAVFGCQALLANHHRLVSAERNLHFNLLNHLSTPPQSGGLSTIVKGGRIFSFFDWPFDGLHFIRSLLCSEMNNEEGFTI